MNVLITGTYGQLGSEIKDLAGNYPNLSFIFTDIDTLDITKEEGLNTFFEKNKPNFVVNCAAYTAVDKAEEEKEKARQVNTVAPAILAKACKNFNAKLIHISTDYVFDGKNHRPYVETDPTCPLGVYGATKLEGEQLVIRQNPDTVVIRTSWLYSPYGHNFVKTMLRLGKERDILKVVADQVGSPTYARDLAKAILEIVSRTKESFANFVNGIYHFSNEGICSWYDFAKAIHETGNITCKVVPVGSGEYPTLAKRPYYSVLDKTKIKSVFKLNIPYWKDSLKECIDKILID